MSLSDADKEKIRLRATFVDGTATGVVLIGAFTPITPVAYDPAIGRDALALMALLTLVCFARGRGRLSRRSGQQAPCIGWRTALCRADRREARGAGIRLNAPELHG